MNKNVESKNIHWVARFKAKNKVKVYHISAPTESAAYSEAENICDKMGFDYVLKVYEGAKVKNVTDKYVVKFAVGHVYRIINGGNTPNVGLMLNVDEYGRVKDENGVWHRVMTFSVFNKKGEAVIKSQMCHTECVLGCESIWFTYKGKRYNSSSHRLNEVLWKGEIPWKEGK